MSRPLSLKLRLLLASSVILPVFLGLSAVMLDRAFHTRQLGAQAESMRLQQLLLARAADWDGSNWHVEGLDEIRFTLANSGLYALVLARGGDILWQSPSVDSLAADAAAIRTLLGGAITGLPALPGLGETVFDECRLNGPSFCHAKGVAWGSTGPESVFLIVESQRALLTAQAQYRRSLLWLLLATAVLLIAAQLVVVSLGLAPLGSLAGQIRQLEDGNADRLPEDGPTELRPLTKNLNDLLLSERQRRERVRSTMDRLTHVLKSPLMLIRNSDESGPEFRSLVDEQVSRMLGIVEGELARAKLDGRTTDILGQAVPVAPVLERIVAAYRRLPRGQEAGELDIDTSTIDEQALFLGDARDLQDLFGSILENSMKYCRQRIEIDAHMEGANLERVLAITVSDDGDGVPQGFEREILGRGARADSANDGYGLGLAIVVEIVSAYQGSLHTGRSPLGGAMFTVRLPVPAGS